MADTRFPTALRARKAQPYLVPDAIDHELVSKLQRITAAAERGAVVGIIFGIVLKGRQYQVDSAGSLERDPTLARGICAAIDDELRYQIQDAADSAATIDL